MRKKQTGGVELIHNGGEPGGGWRVTVTCSGFLGAGLNYRVSEVPNK